MRLTYGSFITALVLIGFSFFVMQIVPSGDCTKLYQDKVQIKKCGELQTIGSIIVIMTVIIVMLIIVGSIFSKEEETKTERPWRTLPKGFDDKDAQRSRT